MRHRMAAARRLLDEPGVLDRTGKLEPNKTHDGGPLRSGVGAAEIGRSAAEVGVGTADVRCR